MRIRQYYREDRFVRPCYVKLSIILVILFSVGSVSAMILFEDYSVSNNYLSHLGTADDESGIIFNLSVISSAVLLIPIFLGIYMYLRPFLDVNSRFMMRLGTIFGLAASLFLSKVGIYPSEGATLALHNLVASLFFICLALSLFFITSTLVYIEDKREGGFIDPTTYLGYSYVPLVILLSDMDKWYSMLLQKFIVYSALIFLIYLVNEIRKIPMTKEYYYVDERIADHQLYCLDEVMITNRILF